MTLLSKLYFFTVLGARLPIEEFVWSWNDAKKERLPGTVQKKHTTVGTKEKFLYISKLVFKLPIVTEKYFYLEKQIIVENKHFLHNFIDNV